MNDLSASLSGDLEQVLVRYTGLLRLAGSRQGIDPSELDDLMQETRIRLWRASERGETITNLPASYLYRTAATAAIDLLRRHRARRETSLDDAGTVAGPAALAADTDTLRSETERAVAEAVDRLSDSRRPVVRMYLAGYSREEIAAQMGWTDGKVRNLLYRGLDDLRADLRARGLGPGSLSEAS